MAITFKPLTLDECEVTIRIEEEDIPVRGNAMATDEPDLDKEQEDEILRQLDSGNVAAWCYVVVEVTWRGYKGRYSLGACSYGSEDEITRKGGCVDEHSMKENALDDLNSSCAAALATLLERTTIADAISAAGTIIEDDLFEDPDRVEDSTPAYQLAVLLIGEPDFEKARAT